MTNPNTADPHQPPDRQSGDVAGATPVADKTFSGGVGLPPPADAEALSPGEARFGEQVEAHRFATVAVPVVEGPPFFAPLPGPNPGVAPFEVVPARRSWLGVVGAVVFGLVCAAGASSVAYQVGQSSYTSPPGEIAIVDGAADDVGYAEQVHKVASGAVVRINLPGGGAGTGFFYSQNRIVTNAHVVTASAAAMKAVGEGETYPVNLFLADGREREGTVIGVDSRVDLAVIEVEKGLGVDPLAFTPSADLSPGQPVAVLGHPFGESLMVTTGVLSGVSNNSRFVQSDVQPLMLQTDAAVNPGNSGGPLLDASGAVMGVITLRPDEADGRQVAGLTLAIPGDVVRSVVEQLEKDGKVRYPVLGVSLRDVTADDKLDMAGAVVTDVTPNSGAAEVGVEPGWVITAIAGSPVEGSQDVVEALVGKRPGDRIRFRVVDDQGQKHTLTASLGSR